MASLVRGVVCAALCGMHRGQRDLASFAAQLTPAQMQASHFPRRGNPRRYLGSEETIFFRLLPHLEPQALERALLGRQDHVLDKLPPEDDQVAINGKELFNSQGLKIVGAYAVKSARWLGSEPIAIGSNEIPAVRALLRRTTIEGKLVTGDALHAQLDPTLSQAAPSHPAGIL